MAIQIINSTIRELTDPLEELVEIIDKYRTSRNIGRTSETLINAGITVKNLTERKRRDNVAPTPQDNHDAGHDLLPDWELEQTKEWKEDDQPGYDTEELFKAGESTKTALEKKASRIQQAMERDIARLLDPDNVLMTRKKYAALQEAWEAWSERSE